MRNGILTWVSAVKRIDMSSIVFFIGILLAVCPPWTRARSFEKAGQMAWMPMSGCPP